MERYWLEASLIDLNEIPSPPLNLEPVYIMLLKEYLIRGMNVGRYSDEEREVVDEKIVEG